MAFVINIFFIVKFIFISIHVISLIGCQNLFNYVVYMIISDI